jgi:ribosomal protein RSM22 (predicted rRNA methylase)
VELPKDLRDALDTAVAGIAVRDLAAAVERLIGQYRAGGEPTEPILRSGAEVAAYAAYRMPATFASMRAVLGQVVAASPGLRPRTHLDIGGGTGAAAWAAAEVFDTLSSVTVLDQVADALSWGERLARDASAPALRTATWRQAGVRGAFPRADLATVSYVLGELSGPDQDGVVRRAAAAADAVVIVEPGTPAGYQRVLAARSVLLDLGLTVAAPCPHQHACPLPAGRDWCHFAVRVNRSSLHRRIKHAALGYEDEKFAYVAAVPGPVAAGSGRVLRHPQSRKGLVMLQLCTSAGSTAQELVSKRHGELYRAARDVEWGDTWPPADQPDSTD